MSTETTQAVNEEVSYTPEQQAHMEKVIQKATARAGSEGRLEAERARAEVKLLNDKLASLEAELSVAKTSTSNADGEKPSAAVEAKISEFKSITDQVKSQLEESKRALAGKDAEINRAKEETKTLRKITAINASVSNLNFVNSEYAVQLTKDYIKWDDSRSKFVVLGPDGAERMNSNYDPMSLDEFYTEFAAKNPFLIRGDVKSGTGASTSQRHDVSANGKFTVEQIFGKKSSGKLANDLAKSDMKEYQRLKGIAKSSGLIA